MLRYTTYRPGLVALYDIRSGNGAGQFLQPQSPARGSFSQEYFVEIHPQILVILYLQSKNPWKIHGFCMRVIVSNFNSELTLTFIR